ncbi:MAG: hypothetical protein KBC11_00275 [Candidatus Pacebacteria bacterium]|nr:hypothetical protein [Candidatus Paceibacterota bacterium]
MVPQKQKAIIEDITKCLNELLMLGVDCSMNIDNKDAKLPTQDIEKPILELFYSLVRSYKYDFDGLYKTYHSSGLWRTAIRKSFLMDDPDEKGYWFYHIYGVQPNKLFFIYMQEHFPIALEKALEMFERGYRKEFLAFKFPIEDIRKMSLFSHGIDEILNIIDERYRGNRLAYPKAVGKFFAWLYLLDKKKVEKVLQDYESVVDEDLQTIAKTCRDTLQHEAPEQLGLKIVA